MRCQFCGWDNPQGKEICEKCNKPLATESEKMEHEGNASSNNRPTKLQTTGGFNLKATVRESATDNNAAADLCPKCGYTIENGECASCGYSVGEVKNVASAGSAVVRKTMRPIRKGEKEGTFTLTPISEETGKPDGDKLSYDGNEVVLNRENTDQKNTTITSLRQASVVYDNGKWSIKDESEFKTTFVQAARKIELNDGDLILLGNQLYRFES